MSDLTGSIAIQIILSSESRSQLEVSKELQKSIFFMHTPSRRFIISTQIASVPSPSPLIRFSS
jgi:hypothetical protein